MAATNPRLAASGEARLGRPLHLSWSALFGGGLIGWGTLFLLSLAGASIGLANLDSSAYGSVVSANLGHLGVGVGIFGLVAMLVASFVGGFFVVRIAGERRRREGLLHGAVSWGLSAVALALLTGFAIGGAAGTANQTAALHAGTLHKVSAQETLTPREQASLEQSSAGAAKAAGATAGALGLSLGLALLGAVFACASLSGKKIKDEPRPTGRRSGDPRPAATSDQRGFDERPTILPPTH